MLPCRCFNEQQLPSLPYYFFDNSSHRLSNMSSSVSALFQPLRVGTSDLQHRIVMAPLTRYRADKDHVHGELAKTYYAQRSRVPGTLIVTEATFIAPQAAGHENVPGIWNAAQIAGWKSVCAFPHPTTTSSADPPSQRLRMPFTPMALTFTSNFGPLDVLVNLASSSGKVASISSPPAPFPCESVTGQSLAMTKSFRANLPLRSSGNTSSSTPRQRATL